MIAPVPENPNELRRTKYAVESGVVSASEDKLARPQWRRWSPPDAVDTAPVELMTGAHNGRSTHLTLVRAAVHLPVNFESQARFLFAGMDPPVFYTWPTV